jgi:hypothetical protein
MERPTGGLAKKFHRCFRGIPRLRKKSVEGCREKSHGIVQWFLAFLRVALPLQGKKAFLWRHQQWMAARARSDRNNGKRMVEVKTIAFSIMMKKVCASQQTPFRCNKFLFY